MKLYSTLSHKVEEFKTIDGKKVSFFVCGPTVYDLSHIGHAKTCIQMDVLARVLRQQGYDVTYIQNITDLDDKIIARAKEKNTGWKDLADEYSAKYLEDMKQLGITSVTEYARATDYIPDILRQVQVLLDKGHAYTIDDGIYFEISTFPDYGKLSGRKEVKENDAQTRIDHSEEKRGWNDFCLWKFSKPGEPVWDAPFGNGRPGWHIEDTAITEHFFGPQYDIHGGAVDLIFPHHEAELTQMEAASGKVPFVRYWTHVGFLNIDSAKMSKSLGNFYTIRDVLAKGYDPMAIRLFVLQSHYRSSINFSWELLDAAQNRLKAYQAFADLRYQTINPDEYEISELDYAECVNDILNALQNDLATPKVLSILNLLVDERKNQILTKDRVAFESFLALMDELLGLSLLSSTDVEKGQKELLTQREEARENKDWIQADAIRDQLLKEGISVRDTDYGPIWFRV